MTSKLIPSNPADVMVIRDISPNITTLSVPFKRFGLFRMGGRGTIVRLSSGALSVFSPVALTPAVRAKLEEKGNNLKYIIAPDLEHHLFLSEWSRAFPSAQVIGPEGLPEKRAAAAPTSADALPPVQFSTVFSAKDKETRIGADFDRDFEYAYVPAHPSRELVFLYKPERTLLVADYLFNSPPTEQYSRSDEAPARGLAGLGERLFGYLQSTQGSAMGQRRFQWWVLSRGDRRGYAESARRVDGWDFDRIVPCHGDVVEEGGKGVFRKVFEWHLEGKRGD